MKSRAKYMDSLKALSMIFIYFTHFTDLFRQDIMALWSTGSFRCFQGKIAVLMFTVILGYFAYLSGTKQKKSIEEYTVRRYIYFLICGLFIHFIYYACGKTGLLPEVFSIKQVLFASVFLNDTVYPAFWCISYFLVASFVSYLNGYFKVNWKVILLEMVLFGILFQSSWIPVGLLGNICCIYSNQEKKLPKWSYIILFGLSYLSLWLLYFGEITMMIEGVFAFLIVMFVGDSKYVKKILSLKVLPFLGTISMATFLIHVVIFRVFSQYLFNHLPISDFNKLSLVVFFVTYPVLIALSYVCNIILNKISQVVSGLIFKTAK